MIRSELINEQDAASYNSELIEALCDLVDEDSLYSNVSSIFQSDRLSNFKAYNATAAWIQQTLLGYGLDDVELFEMPADGQTLFSDWVAPLAWDADEAWLEITGADKITQRLCDYSATPDSVIMGSEPTPARGHRGRLIDLEAIDLQQDNIAGCIVLTAQRACDVKRALHDAGALAIISCFHPFPDEDPDSIFWNNCWSDRSGGWWQTATDCRMAGFSISPNAGSDLRRRLAAGEQIQAHVFVDSRVYAGTLPFVTGRIAGTDTAEEELLVLSHLYEHGAHDNATGSATNLEIARSIAAGIASGVIERPRRSLRFLFMAECYGTIAYGQYRRERMQNTKLAISLDGVGAAWPLKVHREADCARSPTGPLLAAVAHEWYRDNEEADIRLCEVEVSDTLLADPLIGVPTAWPHRASKQRTWHTSLDTIDKIDPSAMKGMAIIVGSTLLRLGSLTATDAGYLSRLCADQCLDHLYNKVVENAVLQHEKSTELNAIDMISTLVFKDNHAAVENVVKAMKRHFSNLADMVIQNILESRPAVSNALPSEVFPDELPAATVLDRNHFGHLSLDPLNDAGFASTHIGPRWSPWQIAAYWWIDGRRSLVEIYELMYGEFQVSVQALTDYYLELMRFAYVYLAGDAESGAQGTTSAASAGAGSK